MDPEAVTIAREVAQNPRADPAETLAAGIALGAHGFVGEARAVFIRLAADNAFRWEAAANLAGLARDTGEHHFARRIHVELLRLRPNHEALRRTLLSSLEYDPQATPDERLSAATEWGRWAIARAGGLRTRPAGEPLCGRPLRIGYVSADFCQHTVGLLVKEVIKAHDPATVQVFAYSAGQTSDWVTREIRTATSFRDVATLDDQALAQAIRDDRVDVLVDLSGHTAGSRLTAFALRPSPVMVSWLGYFATTGLDYIDAILMDRWHVPPSEEQRFVEPVIPLRAGRLCFQPVPWAPGIVASPPAEREGRVTFGCFNNTAKLNAQVLDAWARILIAAPESRLILKWRTFNDPDFRRKIVEAFRLRGVNVTRIELRGPSYHGDMLREYADIDIALDPFPFSGGLTTCEALWCGVPVITWPQGRPVSRQTWAILNQIGLAELAGFDVDSYVRIAVALANNPQKLVSLRRELRERMRQSPLMNINAFARELEFALRGVYERIST